MPGAFHFLRLPIVTIDVLIVLIIGVVGSQASILGRGPSVARIAGAGPEIGPLAHAEG